MRLGIRRLEKRLLQAQSFEPQSVDRADPHGSVRPLQTDIETALVDTFGHNTIEYYRFRNASSFSFPSSFGGQVPHSRIVEAAVRGKQRATQLLEGAISLLTERLEDLPDETSSESEPKLGVHSDRVFVVHGHDNEPKEAVARFLENLRLRPVILHEQPNKGRTIIQKFRDEASDVGFAVVLMTPDDVMQDAATRARQNVVLELGFFLGALGPDRVAAIVKGNVERPSDFDGVVYLPFKDGWKMALAKELKAAGYTVDWNIVMDS